MQLILSNLHIADNMSGTILYYRRPGLNYISSPSLGLQTDKCTSKQKTSPLIIFFSAKTLFLRTLIMTNEA